MLAFIIFILNNLIKCILLNVILNKYIVKAFKAILCIEKYYIITLNQTYYFYF